MWTIERVMGHFVGPPLAGLLIAMALIGRRMPTVDREARQKNTRATSPGESNREVTSEVPQMRRCGESYPQNEVNVRVIAVGSHFGCPLWHLNHAINR